MRPASSGGYGDYGSYPAPEGGYWAYKRDAKSVLAKRNIYELLGWGLGGPKTYDGGFVGLWLRLQRRMSLEWAVVASIYTP